MTNASDSEDLEIDQNTTDATDDKPLSQKHEDRNAARASKQKRLEAQLRNNLRRRKSQSRARKD